MSKSLIDYGERIGIYIKDSYIYVLLSIILIALALSLVLLLFHFSTAIKMKTISRNDHSKEYENLAIKACYRYAKNMSDTSSPVTLLNSLPDNISLPAYYSNLKVQVLTAISSFGVYYGPWDIKDSGIAQQPQLNQYDMLIINPEAKGVSHLKRSDFGGKYLIAAIEIDTIISILQKQQGKNHPRISLEKCEVSAFCNAIISHIYRILFLGREKPLFDGVYLENHISLPCMNILSPIAKFFQEQGVLIFLELLAPTFNSKHLPDSKYLNGFILRNVTISREGERRDYFEIVPDFHNIIKTYTDQVTYRQDFICFIEERITNQAFSALSPALVNRFLRIAQYYKFVPWISCEESIFDHTLNFQVLRPINALEYINRIDYQSLKNKWINHQVTMTPCSDNLDWESLRSYFPTLDALFPIFTKSTIECDHDIVFTEEIENYADYDFGGHDTPGQYNYGAFPCSTDYAFLLSEQSTLRKKNLLTIATEHNLTEDLQALLQKIQASSLVLDTSLDIGSLAQTINSLITGILQGNVSIWRGLDSGFWRNDIHFWALCEQITGADESTYQIYVSIKHPSLVEGVLGAFLSVNGYTVKQRITVESVFNEQKLPMYIAAQLDVSTPIELLTFIHQTQKQESLIETMILAGCEKRLMADVDVQQLVKMQSIDLITGTISAQNFLEKKLTWFRSISAHDSIISFSVPSLLLFYEDMRQFVHQNLLHPSFPDPIQKVLMFLNTAYKLTPKGIVDAQVDLFATLFFSAFKVHAFEEVYYIVCDYNPVPAREADQQGLMAELYCLGSKCTEFFDIPIEDLSQMLYDRRMAYLKDNPPPEESYSDRKFLLTYLPLVQCGQDLSKTRKKRNMYNEISAGLIFAVPAIVDLVLLLITGNGTFVNVRMSKEEQTMISMALLITLLLSSTLSPLIASAGSYYLYLFQFPSMATVMIQQLSASLVFVWGLSFFASIILMVISSMYAGILFMFYMIVFSTYFLLLTCLATMYTDGMSIPSGRNAVWMILPLAIVYWPISYFLDLGDYNLITHAVFWSSYIILWIYFFRMYLKIFTGWLREVVQTNDVELLTWYLEKHGLPKDENFTNKRENWKKELARRQLAKEVLSDYDTLIPFNKTGDPYVRKLAKGYGVTRYLLVWHSLNQGYEMPELFGVEWNLNVKLALEDMTKLNKASKVNRTRIMYHWSKYEAGYGLAYILLLLLDRWIVLFSGDSLLGLLTINSPQYGIASGAAIMFFLVSVTVLDFVVKEIWKSVHSLPEMSFSNRDDLKDTLQKRMNVQRGFYFYYLRIYAAICLLILSIFALFLWIFTTEVVAIWVFFLLSFAYTGLIWAIYCKLFTPERSSSATRACLFSAGLGFVVGIPLHKLFPNMYSEQAVFVFCAWLAAFLSWRGVVWNHELVENLLDKPNLITGQHRIPESPNLSNESAGFYIEKYLRNHSTEITIDDNIGKLILSMISTIDLRVNATFDFSQIRETLIDLWQKKEIQVYVVPEGRLVMENGNGYSALPYQKCNNSTLCIFVGVGFNSLHEIYRKLSTDTDEIQKIVEAMIHETMEVIFGYSHFEAVYGEIVAFESKNTLSKSSTLPLRIVSELHCSSRYRLLGIVNNSRRQVVKHLLMNIEVDYFWHKLSNETRKHMIGWVYGKYFLGDSANQDFEIMKIKSSPMSARIGVAKVLSSAAIQVHELAKTKLTNNHQSKIIRGSFIDSERSINVYDVFVLHSFKKRLVNFLDTVGRVSYGLVSGDPYISRELDDLTRCTPRWMRFIIVSPLLLISMIYRNIYFSLLENMVWSNNPLLHLLKQSSSRALIKKVSGNSIQIHVPNSMETAFFVEKFPFILEHYTGIHDSKPVNKKLVTKRSMYSFQNNQLERQTLFKSGSVNVLMEIFYNYESPMSLIPTSKEVVNSSNDDCDIYYYNAKYGYVFKADIFRKGTKFRAVYQYAEPISTQEVIEVTYVADFITIQTCYYTEFKKTGQKIPSQKIQKLTYKTIHGLFVVSWNYSHKRHPILTTKNEDNEVVPNESFFEKDTFNILERPTGLFFDREDLMVGLKPGFVGFKRLNLRFNTRNARDALWSSWLSTNKIDGVWARVIDENLLRKEPLLKRYWHLRDCGDIKGALKYLENNEDNIAAAIYVNDEISSIAHFAIKMSDLYICGIGGDTGGNQLKPQTGIPHLTEDLVQVFGLQTGTWPNANGGVSNCVRDLVNNITTARWNVIAETGNDMELIVKSFQIEEHVNSVCLLPLWGFDFMDHIHGLTFTKKDSEVERRKSLCNDKSIDQFISILGRLVALAHVRDLTKEKLEAVLGVFSDYYDYFQVHDYGVWNDKKVALAWMNYLTNAIEVESTPIELPTIGAMTSVMEFIKRSLFCLTISLPSSAPDVIQTTHHAMGSVYGVLMKIKFGCALQIWDHGVLWREYLSQWSGSQSRFRPFVFNTMVRFARMSATLTLYYADMILPCTNVGNPIWETERASSHGNTCHRKLITRKIDPVINGISNMHIYKPDFSKTLEDPTIVMLSHVVPVKDIKNAILSWDIIVNQFKLDKVYLDIYGSTDKIPWYTVECETLLTTLNLKKNVRLKGFGDSKTVLKSAWAVLNSSMTEGLPLALGEAGLSGAPIICTEAGGSREVIRDEHGNVFGRTVNPNSPYELALGQIAVLGLFDGLEDIAEGKEPSLDAIRLSDYLAAGRVDDIHSRIHAMKEKRQMLGLRLRELVQRKFSGDRYLREHEQMLWIGKHQSICIKKIKSRDVIISATSIMMDPETSGDH